MKIESQPRDDHQVTLTVEVEPQRMEGAKHRAARKISERTKIPGFRPGKVPYEVVLRYVGQERIDNEAVDLLLEEVYPEALEQAKVDPSGPGSLEKIESITPPKFILTVPLMPTVDLGPYRSVRMPYEWKEPGEDKVDEAIEELRRMYSKTESVDRPIQAGDFVLIDLKGIKKESAKDQETIIDRPGYPVFVRTEAKADEWPYPGFSAELIGLNAGENKTTSHAFEKDHKDESLRGETIQFDARVKMVRGAILPELNDEFAKMAGPFENLSALRDAVRANLAMQSKAEYDDAYFVQLTDKIIAGATIKYPPQVIDHEVEHVMEDLKARLAEQGLDLEAYLKSREMDREKFITEEARPAAVHRLERALIMDEVTRSEKIEVNEETLNAAFQHTWGEFRSSDEFRRTMRGKSNPPKRLVDAVAMESANRALTQQTLTRLKEIATGEAGEPAPLAQPDKAAGKKSGAPAKTGARTKKTALKKAPAKKSAAVSHQVKKTTKGGKS